MSKRESFTLVGSSRSQSNMTVRKMVLGSHRKEAVKMGRKLNGDR